MASAAPSNVSIPARLGRYEVVRRIGRGGMAEVFLGRAVGPGGIAKRLCLKRVLPGVAPDPRAVERFTEEARTSLQLQHANIVPVFDFGRDGQDLFLAMEWIDGCDLGALLAALRARGAVVPPLVAAYVACEVAKALAYAHGRQPGGVLHRDVTPRNVLLSRQGEVRLADFGISRALGKPGAPTGTPAYMAPEAARGEPADARSDLYSLGLVLAEMLCGRRVRPSDDPAAAREPAVIPALPELLASPALPESPDLAGASAGVAAVVRALLQPEAAARPASAVEVERALATVLAAATLRGDPAQAGALARLVTDVAPPEGDDEDAGAPGTVAAPTIEATGTRELLPPPVVAAAPPPATARRRAPFAVAGALALAATLIAGVLWLRPSPSAAPPPGAAAILPPAATSPHPLALAARPGAAPAARAPGVPAVAAAAPAASGAPATPESRAPLHDAAPRAHHGGSPRASATLTILVPAGSWVQVTLDGAAKGDAPNQWADIKPGPHRVRVENKSLGFAKEQAFVAKAGEETKLSFDPRAAGE